MPQVLKLEYARAFCVTYHISLPTTTSGAGSGRKELNFDLLLQLLLGIVRLEKDDISIIVYIQIWTRRCGI